MFPDQLDGANVLLYTDRGSYGAVADSGGGEGWPVVYLAVCAYPGDGGVYLFLCGDGYEVITDSLYTSVEECLSARGQGVTWRKKEEFLRD